MGYGPARGLTPGEVQQWAAALGEVDVDAFRARFDPAATMAADIYPSIWDRDPADDDTLGYIADYYVMLRDFVQASAEAQLGLVVYLS